MLANLRMLLKRLVGRLRRPASAVPVPPITGTGSYLSGVEAFPPLPREDPAPAGPTSKVNANTVIQAIHPLDGSRFN